MTPISNACANLTTFAPTPGSNNAKGFAAKLVRRLAKLFAFPTTFYQRLMRGGNVAADGKHQRER